MDSDKTAYYFHGEEGEYIAGVPATDLTQFEFDALSPLMQRDVLNVVVARGDKVIPLYSTGKGKPKAVEPEPTPEPEPVDEAPPAEGEKG